MSFNGSKPPEPMTLRAFDPSVLTYIYFTDYVRDGQVVEIYEDEDAAALETGPTRSMKVVHTPDDPHEQWILEPA